MKTFVMGDIHGAYHALLECFKLSKFDKNEDRLICLGDVCDRGNQIKECIDELLTIPNCIYILGNHDAWALQWALDGKILPEWWDQGGMQTAMSYRSGMPEAHIQFLSKARLYFVDQNRLFVHGGFDPECPVIDTPKEIFLWDRNLIRQARELQSIDSKHQFGNYAEIYVGHTPTLNFGFKEPQQFCNIWAMDTGAGHGAKLTIMDVDTKQFWQS